MDNLIPREVHTDIAPETKKAEITISKKSIKIVVVLLVIVIIVGVVGWNYYEKQKKIVATVDGEVITIDELNKVFAALPAQYQGLVTKASLLDQLVQAKVLYLEAQKQGITISDTELNEKLDNLKKEMGLTDEAFDAELTKQGANKDEIIDNFKKQLVIKKYLDEKVFNTISVSEDDVKTYYTDNSEQFKIGEQVTARHILIGNKSMSDADLSAKAKEVLSKVTKDNFCGYVKEYSMDSASVANCGEYTFGRDDSFVEEFKNLSFKQSPGQMGIVKSQFGYHIIWTVKKTPAKTLTLDEARENIEKTIKAQKEKDVFKTHYETIKKEYTIEKSYSEDGESSDEPSA